MCVWRIANFAIFIVAQGTEAGGHTGEVSTMVLVPEIVDAVGDWACTALYRGAWVDGQPKVERVLELAFPHSLGLVYSAFTAYLGFSPNDSEASTMALAGFGTPRFAAEVRQIIPAASDGTYEVDQRYFPFADFYRGAFSDKFVATFGPPCPNSRQYRLMIRSQSCRHRPIV